TLVRFTFKDLFVLALAIPLMLALAWVIRNTRMGKAMRAVAQDTEMSLQMGIDVNRVISFTFLLGGLLAGAASLMSALYSTTTGKARERRVWVTAGGIALALAFPIIDGFLGLGWEAKAVPIALFIILALGLNVVVGFAGLLDLGYAAFFAIGAYSMAFLTSPQSPIPWVAQGNQVNFFLAMFISASVAAVFGVILGAPTLRLRGDYLAIVT